MKTDILHCKTEFTLDEVARLWAGVEAETPENRENVISALRILLGAIKRLRLIANGPDAIADVPLRTATGDYNWDSPWRSVFVTRQALEDWIAREGWPLPTWLVSKPKPSVLLPMIKSEALTEELAQADSNHFVPGSLTPEAEPAASPSNKKRAHSQQALLRIIGGLTILLIEKSGQKYKRGEKVNRNSLRKDIESLLDKTKASSQGVGSSQFYELFKEILAEDFYTELYNSLYPDG